MKKDFSKIHLELQYIAKKAPKFTYRNKNLWLIHLLTRLVPVPKAPEDIIIESILLHLLTQGHEMRQEQLVEQLDVSKPAVSRTHNSLETKGYITRKSDPDDKRACRIRLTDKALEIGPVVEQVYNHVYTFTVRGIPRKN